MIKFSRVSKASLLLAAVLATGSAIADPINFDQPRAQVQHAVSRAEVKADLLVWRAAGMDSNELGDGAYDVNAPSYQAALERYQALRQSPQFAVLVRQIEHGEHPRVTLASGG